METLGACIERNEALEPVDAVGWALRLCLALEPLHARGGSHGRLSSTAVYVDKASAGSIGWLLPPNRSQSNPPFHCPERAAGGSISQSDDTWAVAVLLYHALTGRLPFKGRTENDVRTRIRAAAPAPLAVFDIEDETLQGIMHHALHRDRPQRTLAVMPLRAELDAWLLERGIEGFKALDPAPVGAEVVPEPTLAAASVVPPPPEPLRRPAQKLPPPPPARPPSDSNPGVFEQLLARAEELAEEPAELPDPSSAHISEASSDAGAGPEIEVHSNPPAAPEPATDQASGLGLLSSAARLRASFESERPPAPPKAGVSGRPPAPLRPLPKPSTPPKKPSTAPPPRAKENPEVPLGLEEPDADVEPPAQPKPPRTVPVVPQAQKKKKRGCSVWLILLLVVVALGAAAGVLHHRGQLTPLIDRVKHRVFPTPPDRAAPVVTTAALGPTSSSGSALPSPSAAAGGAREGGAPGADAGGANTDVDPMTCMRGLFPADTFEHPTEPDLMFVCEENDPRKASGDLRGAVVTGRGRRGDVTTAMKEWAMLGWYEMAALAAIRGKCCPNATKLKLPPTPEPCLSVEESLNNIAAAAALGASLDSMENGVADYKKTLFCLLKIGAMRSYGRHPTPSGGERTTLKKTLQRISPP